MSTIQIDLRGRNAIVTGGSRGIGRAIAIYLSSAGCNVAINYLRHRQAAEAVKKEIEGRGGSALILKGNVAVEEDVGAMFERMNRSFSKLHILVANAASGVLRPIMALTRRQWDWTMNINASSLITLVQHAAPMMSEGGKIIAVSSLGAKLAIPNYAAVGASKAALESLVRHLMLELAPKGISVNCVSAGTVETDALRHFPDRGEMVRHALQRTPSGRLTTPTDVARAVVFLCSDLSDQIQGHTLVVDGGYSTVA
jgi:enoyl-[acyl-carrier protein] reductase III